MRQPYELLLYFILLHIFNGLVSASLVGHVLYSADLMSAICIPHILLMVHRYIYSRYSPIFPMLYQLYYFLPSSTLNSSSSLYLCKKAKLQARIKPTTLCLVIDKENSIESPLDLLHYIYNYYHSYASCLPQSLCPSADFFVTCCDHYL